MGFLLKNLGLIVFINIISYGFFDSFVVLYKHHKENGEGQAL